MQNVVIAPASPQPRNNRNILLLHSVNNARSLKEVFAWDTSSPIHQLSDLLTDSPTLNWCGGVRVAAGW